MVEHACIATREELIYYVQKLYKGTVIYEKFIQTHLYTNTRLLPISFGSIDIKESGLNLNVGGMIGTTHLKTFADLLKFYNQTQIKNYVSRYVLKCFFYNKQLIMNYLSLW